MWAGCYYVSIGPGGRIVWHRLSTIPMDSCGHSIDYPLSHKLSRRFAATIHYPTTILPPGRRFAATIHYPTNYPRRFAATIHYPSNYPAATRQLSTTRIHYPALGVNSPGPLTPIFSADLLATALQPTSSKEGGGLSFATAVPTSPRV